MLTVNPKERITIKDVLLHEWLRDAEMRKIVGNLMDQDNVFDENTEPTLTTSEEPASRELTSRQVAPVRRRMDPPIVAFKRARVE